MILPFFASPATGSHAAETRIDISSPFLSLAHNLPLALIDMSSINSNPFAYILTAYPNHAQYLVASQSMISTLSLDRLHVEQLLYE